MATVNAMLDGMNMLYRTQSKGISVGGLDYGTKLSDLLGTNKTSATKLIGVNLASFGTAFDTVDSLLGRRHTLNGLISEYNSGKSQFQSGLNKDMKTAAKTSAALKKLDYNGANKTIDTAAEKSKTAANALERFLRNSNADSATKNKLSEALAKFTQNSSAEKNTTLNSLRSLVEGETGLTEEIAAATDDAAETAQNFLARTEKNGQTAAKNMQDGLNSIDGYLNYFERTGKFGADTNRLGKILDTVQNEFSRVAAFGEAANELNGFAANYRDNSENSAVKNSADTISDYAALFGKTDKESAGKIADSVTAVRNFLREGTSAGNDTVSAARDALSVLKDFAANYGTAANVGGENLQNLTNAAKTLMQTAKTANEPFAALDTLHNYDKDYAQAKQSGAGYARQTADKISDILDDYNATAKNLQSRTGLSVRYDNFVRGNLDTAPYSRLMEGIGIKAESDGTLSVDKDKLTTAISQNPSGVERVLGRDGLAGRIDNMVNSSSYRANDMFPAFSAFTGRNSFNSFYAADSLPVISYYGNVGNFMDMFI